MFQPSRAIGGKKNSFSLIELFSLLRAARMTIHLLRSFPPPQRPQPGTVDNPAGGVGVKHV